eukprot:m.193690 g.193690  ORF g.193690 m.193690 type:complete len:412 (-) comp16783_c2_seq11:2570-3805(-)
MAAVRTAAALLSKVIILAAAVLALLDVGLAATPRGVILMLADDVGAESFGVYGSERITPHVDAVASRGFLGHNFYSHPVCTPTRGSVISSRYPFRTGITRNTDLAAIADEDCLMAKGFKSANISTFMLGKWQISPVEEFHHISSRCDFDYYFAWDQTDNRYTQGKFLTNIDGLTTESYNSFSFADTAEPLPVPNNHLVDLTGDYSPKVLADLAIDFIKTRGPDEKFFMYYACLLTHNPVTPPPGSTASSLQTRFDAQVRYLDSVVGRVTAALQDMGLDDEVLFMFTSDNGAKGDIETPWQGRLIEGGKFGFADEGVRMPFLAQMTGTVPSGSSSAALADMTDLLPTVYDAFGLSPPDSIDGRSYWTTLLGQPETNDSESSSSPTTNNDNNNNRGRWKRGLQHLCCCCLCCL